MSTNIFINKLKRYITKLRLRPIRVLCFHQTSEVFDDEIYAQPDWLALAALKDKLISYQAKGYHFISLEEAHKHIAGDWIRLKKYIVLTADDGLKCQLEIVPWLREHKIPINIFFNVETLDGKSCGEQIREYFNISSPKAESMLANKLYINERELKAENGMGVFVGMHGYAHTDVTKMSEIEFAKSVNHCVQVLAKHPNYIPFFAYPYGTHTKTTDRILLQNYIIPVYIDGLDNYNDSSCIHRKML